jgi:acyl carrier protein
MVTAETVRELIIAECTAIGYFAGGTESLGDEFDLRASGVIDSLGFLELVTALEDRLGARLELGDLPPERLTMLGPLARAVAIQVTAVNGDQSSAEALQ